ncbi:MAG: hypothetical protein K6G11_05050, partial [Lachnospiraceae bacterium]|nr:hypothetical protein [Lachnospiraceae bacterium]
KLVRLFGIKCKPFLPIKPILSTAYNYRDHRKITVIDGKVSFTGGVNLADEYINRVERFGHWKDTAIKLEGDAAFSFARMFLQMWNLGEKNYDLEIPELNLNRNKEEKSDKKSKTESANKIATSGKNSDSEASEKSDINN